MSRAKENTPIHFKKVTYQYSDRLICNGRPQLCNTGTEGFPLEMKFLSLYSFDVFYIMHIHILKALECDNTYQQNG